MAVSKRPSFLKRQKEQQRLARAVEKRVNRQARKQARADDPSGGDPIDDMQPMDGTEEREEEGTPGDAS